MKIGLIGLPNSGKTTIFNALTKMEANVTAYSNVKAEPNVAVVSVDDDRLLSLTDMYKPKKTNGATIEMIDFPGLVDNPPQWAICIMMGVPFAWTTELSFRNSSM